MSLEDRPMEQYRSIEEPSKYKANILTLLDSIFSYQYLPRLEERKKGVKDPHNHYWDYICSELGHLESVKFVNSSKEYQHHPKHIKATGVWLKIAVNTEGELEIAF